MEGDGSCGEGGNAVKGDTSHCSCGGNTVCHLKTEDSTSEELFRCSKSTSAVSAGSRSKANDPGMAGNASGELAGDKGSYPKDEHSGSGRGELSVGNVQDSCVCDESETGNTAPSCGQHLEEVVVIGVGEIVEVSRMQNGEFELDNTDKFESMFSLTGPKESTACNTLDSFCCKDGIKCSFSEARPELCLVEGSLAEHNASGRASVVESWEGEFGGLCLR